MLLLQLGVRGERPALGEVPSQLHAPSTNREHWLCCLLGHGGRHKAALAKAVLPGIHLCGTLACDRHLFRSQKSRLAAAIRYALARWAGLSLFLDDGRIEIDSNVVERAIRPLALSRKNALFAGSDGGAAHWAVIASLIETCKLIGVEPRAYLADVISKIVNGHPNSRLDELLPWPYPTTPALKPVA